MAYNRETCALQYRSYLDHPDYAGPGPLGFVRLPRLEHTCSSCFPACVGTNCLVRIDVTYPKGGYRLGLGPPYPLAILTGGFLIGSDSYRSYAERLTSWGYTVMLYDKQDSVGDLLDDVTSVRVLRDLIDFAGSDLLLARIADASRVYLVGHSRGGKISALAAAEDPRVVALCLLDPVDNTVYAPLGPGYPSALAALRELTAVERPLPVAVVGAGQGGDCAPQESNYRRFFDACNATAVEVAIGEAGHFQFLDATSPLQRAVCPEGDVAGVDVRSIAQAVLVAWAEAMIRHRGQDAAPAGAAYPHACEQLTVPNPADMPPSLKALAGAAVAALKGSGTGRSGQSPEQQPQGSGTVTWSGMRGGMTHPDEVDPHLRVSLNRIVKRLQYEAHVSSVATRYKNFGPQVPLEGDDGGGSSSGSGSGSGSGGAGSPGS